MPGSHSEDPARNAPAPSSPTRLRLFPAVRWHCRTDVWPPPVPRLVRVLLFGAPRHAIPGAAASLLPDRHRNGPGPIASRAAVPVHLATPSTSPFLPALLSRLQHTSNSGRHPLVSRNLRQQLLATRGSQLVVARPPVSLRYTPLCPHPAFDQHSLQRRIQGPLLHLQHVACYFLYGVGNLVSMHLAAPLQRLQ